MNTKFTGKALETFKKVCEANGIELTGEPVDHLTIVADGTEYTVDKTFNMFSSGGCYEK